MATLGSLVVSLEANMAKFQSDMGRAAQLAEQSMERVNKAAEMAKRGLELVGIAVGAHELWEKFSGAVEAADQMQKLSEKTGVTVEHLSELQYAAKLSGVDTEGLANGLKKLSTAMYDAASGSIQQQAVFKSMGIAYKDANGDLRNAYDVLLDVADNFEKTRNGTTKAAESVKLFGKAGMDLIPLLNEGSEGLRHMAEEAESMGIVLGSDLAKKSEAFKDDLERLQLGMGAITLVAMKSLVPAFDDVVRAFINLNAQKSDTQSFWDTVGTLARWTAAAVGSAWLALKDMGDGLGALAAQANAVLHGNLAQAREIGRERDEQAKKNEEQFKKFQDMALNSSNFQAKTKRPDEKGSQKPIDTTAADKVTAFINQLKEMTEKVGKGEYAMLRMKAASLGAATAIEPYIVKLQQAKEAQQDLIDRQNAQIASTDNLIAQLNKKDFEDPAAVYDFVKAQEKANETYDFQTSLIGKTALEQEKLTALRQIDLAVIERSKTLGADATADLVARMEKEKEAMQKSIDARTAAEKSWQTGARNAINNYIDTVSNAAKQTEALLTNAFKGMEDALVNFVKTGKLDFKSLADSIISDMIRIQIQQNITRPLASALGGSGGILGLVGSLFGGGESATVSSMAAEQTAGFSEADLAAWGGSTLGGARANGGPVSSGQTYLVGERGPELFTPGASGAITPNHAMGGGGVVINVIESPGNGGKTSQRQEGGANIIDIMVEQVKSAIASDIGRGAGPIPGALSSTYGLNRVAGAY